MDPSEESPPPPSSKCDRRISRAAREILRRDVLPILRHYAPPSSSEEWSANARNFYNTPNEEEEPPSSPPLPVQPMEDHPSELVFLLQQLLSQHSNNNDDDSKKKKKCLLDPSLDMHLPHELQSHRTKKLGGRYKSRLYQCGICRKNFVSKYYLDLHMESHHHHNHSSQQEEEEMICPATDLCPALGGMDKCNRISYEIEPYYARGSGGNSAHDSKHVSSTLSRSLQNILKPCHEQDMIVSQSLCTQLFQNCFLFGDDNNPKKEEMVEDLIVHVCQKQTCHATVHELAGFVQHHVHFFKKDWLDHHGHELGFWSLGIVGVLIGFYVWVFLGCGIFGGGGGGGGSRGWLYQWVLKSVRSGGSGRKRRGGLPDRTRRRKEKMS